MKVRLRVLAKGLLLLPLLNAYALESCTADAVRSTADELNKTADRMDGSDEESDLGDWLSEEVQDW